jgi:hypothetical protein
MLAEQIVTTKPYKSISRMSIPKGADYEKQTQKPLWLTVNVAEKRPASWRLFVKTAFKPMKNSMRLQNSTNGFTLALSALNQVKRVEASQMNSQLPHRKCVRS